MIKARNIPKLKKKSLKQTTGKKINRSLWRIERQNEIIYTKINKILNKKNTSINKILNNEIKLLDFKKLNVTKLQFKLSTVAKLRLSCLSYIKSNSNLKTISDLNYKDIKFIINDCVEHTKGYYGVK